MSGWLGNGRVVGKWAGRILTWVVFWDDSGQSLMIGGDQKRWWWWCALMVVVGFDSGVGFRQWGALVWQLCPIRLVLSKGQGEGMG